MKTRLITALTALTLTGLTSAAALADTDSESLAWQQPGYVEEVVIVTAPRPTQVLRVSADTPLASQQPGYVEEVVIVRASRSEVLANARWLDRPVSRRFADFFGRSAN